MIEQITHLIPHDSVPNLMLAGNCTLIFENTETGNTRMFKVKKNKNSGYYRVSAKYYLGWIRDKQYYPNEQSGLEKLTKLAKEFQYLYTHLLAGTLNPKMIIYHTGQCCVCGRRLTDPESIKLGIGPQCRGK